MGVQCVDCVRQQRQSMPDRRTALGAKVRSGAPIVTYVLMGISLVFYVLQMVLGSSFTTSMWFVPLVAGKEPYRFITSAFVHSPGNILHLAFNMYALWIVGPFLEQMLGRARYLALYVLSALGGSTAVLLLANTPEALVTPVVGASGAIFGLFAAVLLVLRRVGRRATQIFIVIALNVVIGFVVPGISWQGHMGGLIIGGLLGALFAWSPRERWRGYALLGTASTLVLLVAAAVWQLTRYGLL